MMGEHTPQKGRLGRGQVLAIAVATSALRYAYLKLVIGRMAFEISRGE
jgi:hypothetical protein